ncbi:MAG: OprO/OprP family phosphate-selective porin [Alphaproteobacteria bacterium]
MLPTHSGRRPALAAAIAIALALGPPSAERAFADDAEIQSLKDELRQLREEVRELRRETGAAAKKKPTGRARPAAPLPVSEQPATHEEVEKIEHDVGVLERKAEVEHEENENRWLKLPKQVELGTQGLRVLSADQNFVMYLRALIQADGSYFMDDSRAVPGNPNGDNLNDSFYMRRVRPILEGTLWKYVDYRIMPDFAGGTTKLFDAIADLRYFRFASLAAGKFKSPISLERLQSASALTFVERAFPTQVAPNRDVGFLLHGEFDQPGHPSDFSMQGRNQTVGGNFPMFMYPDFFSYQLAVVDGSSNNGSLDSDTNDSKEFQGRVFSHPFLWNGPSWAQGIGVGLAGSWGNPNDVTLSSYQSSGLQTIFTYDKNTKGDGVHSRLYPQAYWVLGPFQAQLEYAWSRQEVANQLVENNLTRNDQTTGQTVSAWNATVSWVLTGEKNVFLNQGIKPFHNFNPWERHWGAFQIAARAPSTSETRCSATWGRPTSRCTRSRILASR